MSERSSGLSILAKFAASLAGAGVASKTGSVELAALVEADTEEAIAALGSEITDLRRQRASAWWTHYVRQLGRLSDEGAITEAHILQEGHPDFRERVYEALQAVWGALDVAVAPYLAFLAADYEARGAPVDMFYRRFARFLQDTTKEELRCLSEIVTNAERWFEKEGAPEVYAIACRGESAATFSHSVSAGASEKVELGPAAYPVIRRLRDALLLPDPPPNAPILGGGRLDSVGITFEREMFSRAKRFLTPPL